MNLNVSTKYLNVSVVRALCGWKCHVTMQGGKHRTDEDTQRQVMELQRLLQEAQRGVAHIGRHREDEDTRRQIMELQRLLHEAQRGVAQGNVFAQALQRSHGLRSGKN